MMVQGSHDPIVVLLSVVIAIATAYTALNLARRAAVTGGYARMAWILGGAVAMGVGISGMHFVGMLGYQLPLPVLYHVPTVVAALLAAIIASGVALFIVSQAELRWVHALIGSLFMGGGIATMHYTGMAAVRVAADAYYEPLLVALSVVIAIGVSLVGLWLVFYLRDPRAHTWWWRAGGVVMIGFAIPSMHYVAMMAVAYRTVAELPDVSHAIQVSSLGALLIVAMLATTLGLAVITSMVDRHLHVQANALKASEERFSAVAETAADAIISGDCRGSIMYFNPAAERMFGYAASDVLGRPLTLLMPERFREAHHQDMARFFATGEARMIGGTTELVGRKKEGTEFPLELSLASWKIGQDTFFTCIMRDITARKQAEKALADREAQLRQAQAEEKFRRMVEGAPNAIVLVNQAGRIALVNAQAERLFGYAREELVGQSIEILVPARFRGAHPGHRGAFFGDPKTRAMGAGRDLYGLRKDGHEIPIEIGLNPIDSEEGPMVLASIIDITERKRAEAVLREGEERFRTLANNMSQLAWMADEQGRTFWYNQRWFEYTGTTLEEMKGWGWQAVHHPDHVQRVTDKLWHCFQTGVVWEDTFPLRGKDGRFRWFLSRAIPLRNEQGKIFRWFGTNTDVTEQREVEDALRKSRARLEMSNKELDAFSYSVSHDLRAPLRSIDGFSQALLEDCGGTLSEQGKDHLGRIRAASQRMGQLIDDLLNLSRVMRHSLLREPVDLSALALSSANEMAKLWPGRQVELVVSPGLRGHGDARLLRVVFDNLLGNAWKFTSLREKAIIEVGATDWDGTAAYFVRDNGAGFDMAYAGKLFRAFQRLHAATEYPGTGIGLATVQRIIVRHGGRVWAEGKENEGAAVYFTLGG